MEMNLNLGAVPMAMGSHRFHARDRYSALSHFVGLILAIAGTFPLLLHGGERGCSRLEMLSLCAFMAGAILLYGASTAYHTFDLDRTGYLRLKRLDHSMIYFLIVGSYMPVCVFGFWQSGGKQLALLASGVAVLGIIFTMFWVTCPKWISSVIYIALGWMSVIAVPQLIAHVPLGATLWLVAGGVLYTVGGVIYALKLPGLEKRFPGFGAHELFHLFVVAGTICHYVMVYFFLIG